MSGWTRTRGRSMPTLGVNGWRIQGHRTGVGRFILNVVRHWDDEAIGGRFGEVNFYTPIPIDRREVPFPAAVRVHVTPPNWRMLLWENLRLPAASSDDVLFCPSFSRPLFVRGEPVVAIYDLAHHAHPELFRPSVRWFYRHVYAWSGRHAKLVITSSEESRADLIRLIQVPAERTRVVSMAAAETFGPMPRELVRPVARRYFGADVPFFIFVGKRGGRRNLPVLLEALAKVKDVLPHKLLLVGPANISLAETIAELGLDGTVRQAGYVDDEELNLIMNAAEALVMPSAYETVSLPVMEAQAAGTPVICLNSAGNREITAGAAVFIPTLDSAALATAMCRIADSPELRRELHHQGLISASRYSWRRCALETLDVLAEAAGVDPQPGSFS